MKTFIDKHINKLSSANITIIFGFLLFELFKTSPFRVYFITYNIAVSFKLVIFDLNICVYTFNSCYPHN